MQGVRNMTGVTSQTGKQMRDQVRVLFKEPAVKDILKRFSELRIPDSSPYFLENIERIFSPNYVPSIEDILRVRLRTTGIYELRFTLNDTPFILVDVGGQRNERRKWIHCFSVFFFFFSPCSESSSTKYPQNVTAIIFCVALSEYDLSLEEDSTVNRMKESHKLFLEACYCHYFKDISIMLFLNKEDLFREKIRRVDLSVCFEDYKGGLSYEKALDFIKRQFSVTTREVYSHVTVATHTDSIKFVLTTTLNTILTNEANRDLSV
eukprot:TRINITY_DN2949_c0_g1_i17.p1 TRINITY_DN2949_c0_g1~~TRINITY_DN2949_c0_g1_i17.p1  ORF type:complete len:264 (+),score=39.25 TRINITY_DN2949_c0_g1_i17:420-1211(+)